jgi:hypothetical protein
VSDRLPAAREHQLVSDVAGQMNPRCLRCQRTLIDIVLHPRPCRRPALKAALEPARQERAG